MILAKGNEVIFQLAGANGRVRTIRAPVAYEMLHDQGGEEIRKCAVFVGPVKWTSARAEMKGVATSYFGKSYDGRIVKIGARPKPESFRPIGELLQIDYVRRGKHASAFWHPFKRGVHPLLSKSGRWFHISLDNGNACIYDDRGYVFP